MKSVKILCVLFALMLIVSGCAKRNSKTVIGSYETGNGMYEGEMVDGVANGTGVLTTKKGNVCEGEFKNGKANGYCIYTYYDGNVYEGEMVDNMFCGKGIFKCIFLK